MIRQSNSLPNTTNRGVQKKYYGNYLGVVIQNNDPDQRGRIKIYIPHINPSIYDNWDRVIKDKKFKFLGDNINSDLTNIIDELKQVLPWAECASPIVGASSSGTYNAHQRQATISDSNKPQSRIPADISTKYKLNTEGIGEKPARRYEIDSIKLTDAFSTTEGDGAPEKINKHTHQFMIDLFLQTAQ